MPPKCMELLASIGRRRRRVDRVSVRAVDPASPLSGLSRETNIRRDRQGRWWNGADPITHPGLVHAFEGWLGRSPDGRLCLENSIHWVHVTVEGAPYFVRHVRLEPGGLVGVLSGGAEEVLDLATLAEDDAGVLYVRVRGGSLWAQFDRAAQQGLAEWLGEDEGGPYLTLAGRVHRPRRVASFEVLAEEDTPPSPGRSP